MIGPSTLALMTLIAGFVQPLELTDPFQVLWIRSMDDMDGPVYFPWYPGVTVDGLFFPWIPDLSFMHGTFWLTNSSSPHLTFFQPDDTTRPMTYLFSQRGTGTYSHVGAFFGRDLGRLRIHGGADFKAYQRDFMTVTSHNAWLLTRIRWHGDPTLMLFRADQSREQERAWRFIQLRWNPSWAHGRVVRWDAEETGWTIQVRRFLGIAEMTATTFPSRLRKPFFSFQIRVPHFPLFLGVATLENQWFPVGHFTFGNPSCWLEIYSEAHSLWVAEDSVHPLTMPRQVGIRGAWSSRVLRAYAQIQSAWDQWVFQTDRYQYRAALQEAFLHMQAFQSLGALEGKLFGNTYLWRDSVGVYESSIVGVEVHGRMQWRDGRITALPGVQMAWLTDPERLFRVDILATLTFFESVRVHARIAHVWETPTPLVSRRRYTVLIAVRLPD